ncbi:Rho guanine nucleotide exchange factor 4 [Taenia solium]|eukprot:TsM_001091300 transcript=TsM_001091300 gene=TsM_001091300
MYTPQLKYSELSLEHRRPSSGRVYSHSCSPDSSAEARVALKKVAWVISELLETELAYLESLRDIKEGYYLPLLAEGKFDATTLDTVFNNITQLHAFHQTFSGELYRNQENLVGLANVFLEHAVDFEGLYVEFCTEHSLHFGHPKLELLGLWVESELFSLYSPIISTCEFLEHSRLHLQSEALYRASVVGKEKGLEYHSWGNI